MYMFGCTSLFGIKSIMILHLCLRLLERLELEDYVSDFSSFNYEPDGGKSESYGKSGGKSYGRSCGTS